MFDRLAGVRPRTLVIGVVVTAAVIGLLGLVWPVPRVEELGGPLLDLRLAGAGTDTAAYVDGLGAQGRRLYGIFLVADMGWAILHAIVAAAVIAVALARAGLAEGARSLVWLPLAATALDLVENSSFLAAVAAHPGAPPVPAAVANVATPAKFALFLLTYVAVAGALLAWRRAARASA